MKFVGRKLFEEKTEINFENKYGINLIRNEKNALVKALEDLPQHYNRKLRK